MQLEDPRKRKRLAAEEINDEAQRPIVKLVDPAEKMNEPKEPTEEPTGQADQMVEEPVGRIEDSGSTSYSEWSSSTMPRWPPAGHHYWWDGEEEDAAGKVVLLRPS
jgi:hypothetical protein